MKKNNVLAGVDSVEGLGDGVRGRGRLLPN